ncbi:MAG: glycosyltransferase [Candidatus Omnitrophota bacterium]
MTNKSGVILMLNPMDTTYGSTHRIRQIYYGLISLGWKVNYIESNYSGKENITSITQKNNIFGFLGASLKRIYYALFCNYDIFFTQTFTPLTVPAMIAAKLRKKTIAVDWDDLSCILQKNCLRYFLVWLCEHFFIRLADYVFVPNDYLLNYGRKLGVKNIFFASHGVNFGLFDPERFNAELIKKQLGFKGNILLGFLASFTTGGVGDFDIVLQAVNEIIRQREDMSFLIIGGGPLFSTYKKKAEAIGLKNIYFTGLIKQEEVPGYLSCVDIALIFMRDNLKNKMKTSLKVGEYLAMNKVVVGHLAGQTKDMFSQYCINCSPTVNSFVEAINSALNNPSKVSHREELIEKYTWKKSVEVIDQILSQL